MNWDELAMAVDDEYARAREKFPGANHNLHAFVEEAGELQKAAFGFAMEGKGSLEEVQTELVQTMAMCLRLWFEGDMSIGLPRVMGE